MAVTVIMYSRRRVEQKTFQREVIPDCMSRLDGSLVQETIQIILMRS